MLHKLLGIEAYKEPEPEKKVKKLSFFDIVNMIYEKKPAPWFEIEKEYTPFMINRALSQGMDTVLFANEMNRLAHIDKDLQYKYFVNNNGIRARKRFNKWAKAANAEEDVRLVMSYYNINRQKAEEVMDIVDLKTIIKNSEKGGLYDATDKRQRSKL